MKSMKSLKVSLVLLLTLSIPTVSLASPGKYVSLEKGQMVPWKAWCFDETAAANIVAEKEFAQKKCQLKIKKEKEEKYYPTLGYSLKPFVLLFDEIYTDLYRIGEAQQRMIEAKKMVFMGTSFSVNITAIALRIAASNSIDIEIIDPNPIDIGYKHATYFEMSALEYVESFL